MSKRDYIEEILAKQGRLHKRGSRMDIVRRRVLPVVKGFRDIKAFGNDVSWKSEWLKYGAIGYIGCVEGYFRLLMADLINAGEPFVSRISDLKEIRFTADTVAAIHTKKISLGQFIAHLLPINGVSDINSHLSALLGTDFLSFYAKQPLSPYNTKPIGEVFPDAIGKVESLFKLRHLYTHELATRERVSARKIEALIGSTAMFVFLTDEMIGSAWLADA